MTPSISTTLLPESAHPGGASSASPEAPWWKLHPELIPDLEGLVIEDGKPVDGVYTEKQMRLLTEPLHNSWSGPAPGVPFVAMADVGVFHSPGEPPIVPDILLAIGVHQGADVKNKANLSYFVWVRGKVPDVAFEVVSNKEGGEDTDKLEIYARIGVLYYVIFDPLNILRQGIIRVFRLQGQTYQLLNEPWWFEEVGLGLKLWDGRYEDLELTWLRWYGRDGRFIATGAEEHQRAEQERQRAERERQRAEQAFQEVERLKERLRQLGIDPPG